LYLILVPAPPPPPVRELKWKHIPPPPELTFDDVVNVDLNAIKASEDLIETWTPLTERDGKQGKELLEMRMC
jgi:hypothetical protein